MFSASAPLQRTRSDGQAFKPGRRGDRSPIRDTCHAVTSCGGESVVYSLFLSCRFVSTYSRRLSEFMVRTRKAAQTAPHSIALETRSFPRLLAVTLAVLPSFLEIPFLGSCSFVVEYFADVHGRTRAWRMDFSNQKLNKSRGGKVERFVNLI